MHSAEYRVALLPVLCIAFKRLAIDDTVAWPHAESSERKVFRDARIVGIHDNFPDIFDDDPRFNHRSNDDFAVVQDIDGKYTMVMNVNWPEYVLFEHVTKQAEGDEKGPSEYYARLNKFVSERSAAESKTPAKKPAAKKAVLAEKAVAKKSTLAKKAAPIAKKSAAKKAVKK
jgi:hypothetical protein